MEARQRDQFRHYKGIQAVTYHQGWRMRSNLCTSRIPHLPPVFTVRHWATRRKWSRQATSHLSQHWSQVNQSHDYQMPESQSSSPTRGYHHLIRRILPQIQSPEATVWCLYTRSIAECQPSRLNRLLRPTTRRCRSTLQVMQFQHKLERVRQDRAWQSRSHRILRSRDSLSHHNNDNRDWASIAKRKRPKAKVQKEYLQLIRHVNPTLTTY